MKFEVSRTAARRPLVGAVFARLLWVGLAVWVGLFASGCAVEEETEDQRSGFTLQRLEDLDQRGAWVLYQWYLQQGLLPCDPPPDPWHPFVRYGYCSADGIQHEPLPDDSYDE